MDTLAVRHDVDKVAADGRIALVVSDQNRSPHEQDLATNACTAGHPDPAELGRSGSSHSPHRQSIRAFPYCDCAEVIPDQLVKLLSGALNKDCRVQ
jgi:hypothetical protein